MPFLILLVFLSLASSANDSIPDKQAIDPSQHYHYSLIKDGALITAGILAGLSAGLIESSVKPLSAEEINELTPESVNRFDRSATQNYSPAMDNYSYLLAGALMAAPFGLVADPAIRKDWKAFSSMYLEVMLFSYALPSFGKGFAERKRPYVYNPVVPMEKKREKDAYASFFSRHTTYGFASAVFLSTLYGNYYPESPLKPYLWAIYLSGASAVGFMRYQSGVHFPTDILTGAVVGTVIGYGIPWLHLNKNNKTSVCVDPVQRAVCFIRQF